MGLTLHPPSPPPLQPPVWVLRWLYCVLPRPPYHQHPLTNTAMPCPSTFNPRTPLIQGAQLTAQQSWWYQGRYRVWIQWTSQLHCKAWPQWWQGCRHWRWLPISHTLQAHSRHPYMPAFPVHSSNPPPPPSLKASHQRSVQPSHRQPTPSVPMPQPLPQLQATPVWLNRHDGNRMAWQWAETLVEIRGTLVDIRGTTKLGCRYNFPKHEFNRPVCLEAHHYLLAHLSQ